MMRSKHVLIAIAVLLASCHQSTARAASEGNAVCPSSVASMKAAWRAWDAVFRSEGFVKDRVASDHPMEWSFDDFMHKVLARNPALHQAWRSWGAALDRINETFSWPDPVVSFTDYIEEVQTRVGPQESAWSVRQTVPWPGRLWFQRKKAIHEAQASCGAFHQRLADLYADAAAAFFDYAYLEKAIAVTEENRDLLAGFERVAQKRYATALTENRDLLKVQVELGRIENDLIRLKDLRRAHITRLNALMNTDDASPPLPHAQTIEQAPQQDVSVSFEEWMERALTANAGLWQSRFSKQAAEAQAVVAYQRIFPDVTVSYTRIATGPALNPSTAGSGEDAQMVTVGVNVPLWIPQWHAHMHAAHLNARQALDNEIGFKQNLRAKVAADYVAYQDSLRQSVLYADALIPRAVQTMNAVKAGYETGEMDFLSLIDAQRTLLQFQLTYYRMNAEAHKTLWRLKAATLDLPVLREMSY